MEKYKVVIIIAVTAVVIAAAAAVISFMASDRAGGDGGVTQNGSGNSGSGSGSSVSTGGSSSGSGSTSGSDVNSGSEEEMLDFASLELQTYGMEAGYNVFEAVKTDSGMKFDNYYLKVYYNSILEKDIEEKEIYCSADLDNSEYERLAAALAEYDIRSWKGFGRSNPDVLDGGGFTFECVLADGSRIRASGSNAYPENYDKLRNLLYEMSRDNR